MLEVITSVVINILKIPNMSVLIIWVAINMAEKKKIIMIIIKLKKKKLYHNNILNNVR